MYSHGSTESKEGSILALNLDDFLLFSNIFQLVNMANEIFLRISALASKKRLNQKHYYYKYVK